MGTRPEVILPESQSHALTIRHKFNADFEQFYFLQSDVHWDSTECLRNLYTRHLKQAAEVDALILDNGDLPDVISGRHDKRGSKDSVRTEHAKGTYLDEVVDDMVQFYKPYADNLVYLGRGNHDQKILAHCETDILGRFAKEISRHKSPGLPPVHVAGYGGWIKFTFEHASGGRQQCYRMKLFHGSGGGGEVTKGAMTAQRMAATVGNADIVVTGHIHESWTMSVVQETLNEKTGEIQLRERKHVQLGSYKIDYRVDGAPTWHMMRPGGTPKPVGGKFLRFYATPGHRIAIEVRDLDVDYSDLS